MKGHEGWRLAIRNNVRVEFSQKDTTGEGRLTAFDIHANAVAYQSLAKTGRHLGRKIARLVGVRHDDVLRVCISDYLLQRRSVGIGRVLGQLIVFGADNLFKFVSGDFLRQRRRTQDDGRSFLSHIGAELLHGGNGLERRFVQRAVSVFDEYENSVAHLCLQVSFDSFPLTRWQICHSRSNP